VYHWSLEDCQNRKLQTVDEQTFTYLLNCWCDAQPISGGYRLVMRWRHPFQPMGSELSFNGVFVREKCTKICEVLTPEFRWSSLSYFTVEYSWRTADSRNQFVWYRMWELSGIQNVSARFLSWCSWWALDTVTKRFEFPLESDAPTLRISGRVIRHPVFWRSTYWFVMFICLKEVFRKRCKLFDWCTLDLRSTVLRLKSKSGLAAADRITPSFYYYYLGKTSAGVKHLEKSSELIHSLFVYCYCIIDFDIYIII